MARILIVVSGGIAAYKVLQLVRRLRERGHETPAILTDAAAQFVTPLSLGALSNAPVLTDLFDIDREREIGHIRLARSADLVLVAPASADILARMAQGRADDLAAATLLATGAPVLVAPAMNPFMWAHPATRRNVATLRADGIRFVGPDHGEMAERGEAGVGRLADPLAILAAAEALLAERAAAAAATTAAAEDADAALAALARGRLAGRHVVVTSGPTHEPIDPVRFIANRSSGKQGHAVAAALAAMGARVTLVSGPVTLPDPPGVHVVRIETAREMLAAVEAALPADAAVMAAAVADWRVEAAGEKLKKGTAAPALALTENPDILATVARSAARPRVVVGFAAETQNVIGYARDKLARKGCDLIVANDVSTGVFGADANTVHLVSAEGVEDWPAMSKREVGVRLATRIADRLDAAG